MSGLPIIGPLLFPKTSTLAPIPPLSEPALSPDPDDKALKAKRRRRVAEQGLSSGRLSTTDQAPLGTTLG